MFYRGPHGLSSPRLHGACSCRISALPLRFLPFMFYWSPQADLNRRPRSYQERALPLSYVGLDSLSLIQLFVSGGGGRIRTYEALPGARFTVWWFKPLTHPSPSSTSLAYLLFRANIFSGSMGRRLRSPGDSPSPHLKLSSLPSERNFGARFGIGRY